MYGAACPVAVVARASRDDEVILRGTLTDIPDLVRAAGITRTAVIVIGVWSGTTSWSPAASVMTEPSVINWPDSGLAKPLNGQNVTGPPACT